MVLNWASGGRTPDRSGGKRPGGSAAFRSIAAPSRPKLPRSLAVIGAGVIGAEYATIFSALDIAVTLDRTAIAVPRFHPTGN